MDKKTFLIASLTVVLAAIVGSLYYSYNVTEKLGPQSMTITGNINWISDNSEEMNVIGSDGNNYEVVLASSTQVISDAGGTFGFGDLRLRDSVSIVGKLEPDGDVAPSLIEQTNSGGID